MVFHPLVSKIWTGTDQNGTFFDNKIIGVHLECAIQVEMVLELESGVSSNRKEAISSILAQIHHMQESYERVRKCAMVKGRVELKIDKPRSKDL